MDTKLFGNVILGASLILNMYFGKAYFEHQKESKIIEQGKPMCRLPERAYLRKQNGSLMSGGLLLPALGAVTLISADGKPLKTWNFGDETPVISAKLLRDGSVMAAHGVSIKQVDKDDKVVWEMTSQNPLVDFNPFLWTVNEDGLLYKAAAAADGCPRVIRMNKEKKTEWEFDLPKEACFVDPKSRFSNRSVGIANLDYTSQLKLANGGPALALSTGREAIVVDVTSKKIVWWYRQEDGKPIATVKFAHDGAGVLIVALRERGRMGIAKMDFEKDKAKSSWIPLGWWKEGIDIFDLGEGHILFSDGVSRTFELSLNEQGKIYWSYYFMFETLLSKTWGSSYVREIPSLVGSD